MSLIIDTVIFMGSIQNIMLVYTIIKYRPMDVTNFSVIVVSCLVTCWLLNDIYQRRINNNVIINEPNLHQQPK